MALDVMKDKVPVFIADKARYLRTFPTFSGDVSTWSGRSDNEVPCSSYPLIRGGNNGGYYAVNHTLISPISQPYCVNLFLLWLALKVFDYSFHSFNKSNSLSQNRTFRF